MFNMVGFLAAVTAASARALKSVLQGLMLSDSHERMDSLSLLMYMAPVAVVALIPTTLFFEPDAAAQAIELGRNGSECRRWGGGGGGRGGPRGRAGRRRRHCVRALFELPCATGAAHAPVGQPTTCTSRARSTANITCGPRQGVGAAMPASSILCARRRPRPACSVLDAAAVQLPPRLLCQPHQLFGDQAHLGADAAGAARANPRVGLGVGVCV